MTSNVPSRRHYQPVSYADMRSDWYQGVDYMVTLLRRIKREGAPDSPLPLFIGFPLQWLPLFELLGAQWKGACASPHYIPFLSKLDEISMMEEISAARGCGQLRLLVESIAGSDAVLSEVLPRIDGSHLPSDFCAARAEQAGPVRLTNWHAYGRGEVLEYEQELLSFKQTKQDVIFLPCGRKRPYDKSPTHRKRRKLLSDAGVNVDEHDIIVITSLGPVPESLWNHPTVLRYDTGVRDVYRMLVLFRRMLRKAEYRVAWDCLSLRPYRDLIHLLKLEGFVKEIRRPKSIKNRKIPVYSG